MKRTIIYSLIVGVSALCVVSCMKIDNFDGPNAQFGGRIIDSTTDEPILASQGHGRVRIWEKSYDEYPAQQDIPLKQDGTFNNNKLFAGTYDVLPEGPWWPADTIRKVGIGAHKMLDIEVTPYLKLIDFEYRLEPGGIASDGKAYQKLYMSCRLDAPIAAGLPMILDIRPFISRTVWVGPGNDGNMSWYDKPAYRLPVNKEWANIAKDPDGKSVRQELPALEVYAGYTYYFRMGARVNDVYQNFNLTRIESITLPL